MAVVTISEYPPKAGGVVEPNSRQALAASIKAEECLYGGAWGGGKTDWLIAEVIKQCVRWPYSNTLMIRKTLPEFKQPGGIIQRLNRRLVDTGLAKFNATDHKYTLWNKSEIQLGYCESDDDLTRYRGGEYDIIAIDQAEDLTEYQWTTLGGRLRSSGERREEMEAAGTVPRLLLTANPGGVSHAELKERFIDPFPQGGTVFLPPQDPDSPVAPRTRCFVPSNVFDNRDNIGDNYIRQIMEMAEEDRLAALGSWEILKGSRFKQWNPAIHVVDPAEFPIPLNVPKVNTIDWGQDHPMVALWIALVDDITINPVYVVYRELVLTGESSDRQARMVREQEVPGEHGAGRVVRRVLDPSCWKSDHHEQVVRPNRHTAAGVDDTPPKGSIADVYRRNGLHVTRADNRRIDGWAQLDILLRQNREGVPRLLVHSSCTELIREFPIAQRDPKRPGDVKKFLGDDALDALRYGIMAFEGSSIGDTPPPVPVRPEVSRVQHPETSRATTRGLRTKRW